MVDTRQCASSREPCCGRRSAEDAENRVGIADIDDEKHSEPQINHRAHKGHRDSVGLRLNDSAHSTGRTSPDSTVRIPASVWTSRNPRSSSPAVTPSYPPFSSTCTRLPRVYDDRCCEAVEDRAYALRRCPAKRVAGIPSRAISAKPQQELRATTGGRLQVAMTWQ